MNKPISGLTEILGKSQVTIVYTWDNGYSIEFKAYEIVGIEDGTNKFIYEKEHADSSNDTTYDVAEAANYVRGFVKSDGCSHFYFGDADNSGYLHLCGKQPVSLISQVIKHVYNRCGEIMNALGESLMIDGEFPVD